MVGLYFFFGLRPGDNKQHYLDDDDNDNDDYDNGFFTYETLGKSNHSYFIHK